MHLLCNLHMYNIQIEHDTQVPITLGNVISEAFCFLSSYLNKAMLHEVSKGCGQLSSNNGSDQRRRQKVLCVALYIRGCSALCVQVCHRVRLATNIQQVVHGKLELGSKIPT